MSDFDTVRYWMHGWGLPGRDWSEGDAALDRIEAELEHLRIDQAGLTNDLRMMTEARDLKQAEVERLQSELATSRELRSYQDKTIIRGRRIEEAARELLPVVQYFADLDNPYLGVEQERLMKLDGAIRALRAALGEES